MVNLLFYVVIVLCPLSYYSQFPRQSFVRRPVLLLSWFSYYFSLVPPHSDVHVQKTDVLYYPYTRFIMIYIVCVTIDIHSVITDYAYQSGLKVVNTGSVAIITCCSLVLPPPYCQCTWPYLDQYCKPS